MVLFPLAPTSKAPTADGSGAVATATTLEPEHPALLLVMAPSVMPSIVTGNVFGLLTVNLTSPVPPGTNCTATVISLTARVFAVLAAADAEPEPVTNQAAHAAPAPPKAMTDAAM